MINYFISSTFSDTHMERDLLAYKILPKLKRLTDNYGQEIAFTDLRWGINSTDYSEAMMMNKVLSTCIKEINKCCPYMIILLGDKYGYQPNNETLQRLLLGDGGNLLSQQDQNKSVTDLEVTYGLLRRTEFDYSSSIVIAIRNSLDKTVIPQKYHSRYFCDNEEEQKKLDCLKRQLSEICPNQIIYYDATWNTDQEELVISNDFEDKMIKMLTDQIKKALPELPPSIEEQQYIYDNAFQKRHYVSFVGRKEETEQIQRFINDPSHSVLLIKGKSGMGKSALLSNACYLYESKLHVVSLFCGNGKFLQDVDDVKRSLIWRLRKLLGDDNVYKKADFKDVIEPLLDRVTKSAQLLIIIDGIDQLKNDIHLKNMDFLPEKYLQHQRIKWIISMSEEFQIPYDIKGLKEANVIRLLPLQEKEIEIFTNAYLKKIGKELPVLIKQKLNRKTVGRSPLYNILLLSRINLLNRNDYTTISMFQNESVRGDLSIYSYIELILNQASFYEKEIAFDIIDATSRTLSFPLAADVFYIVSCFRNGISIKNIIEILCFANRSTSFAETLSFIEYLDMLLKQDENGKVQFVHKLVIPSQEMLMRCTGINYKHIILEYLDQLDDDETFKREEYVYFSYACNNAYRLACYLSKTYCKEEKLARISLVNDINNYGVHNYFLHSDALIHEIIEIYQTSKKKGKQVITFLLDVIDSTCDEHRLLYGVVSAFVFGNSLLNILSAEDCNRLLNRLYQLCKEVLYPNATWNADYLRLFYVCCERCALRSTDLNTQLMFSQQFMQLCLEYSERQDIVENEYLENIHDLAMANKILGESFSHISWSKAIHYYRQGIKVINHPLFQEKRRQIAIQTIHELETLFLQCLINKMSTDKQIGFPTDHDVIVLVDSNINKLSDAISYYQGNKEYMRASRCCSLMSDYYRILEKHEQEKAYVFQMKYFAEEALKLDKHVICSDHVRNAEFRLGYSHDFGFAIEERIMHLEQAFEYAVNQNKEQFAEIGEKILAVTLQELISAWLEYLENQSQERMFTGSLSIERFIKVSQNMTKWLETLISHGQDNVEQVVYPFLNIVANIASDYRERAIDKQNLKMYMESNKDAAYAFELFRTLGDCYQRNKWLFKMIDISNIVSITAHNVSVWKGELIREEEYYNHWVLSLIMETEILGTKNITLQKIKKKYQKTDFSLRRMMRSWIHVAADMLIDNENMEKFLFYVKLNNYCISGQNSDWLLLLRDIYKPEELESDMNLVGAWICKNLSYQDVRMLIYKSNLFEQTALLYAYKKGWYDIAKDIIYNGYDHYLELPMLFLIYKYDRGNYKESVMDLKDICKSRHYHFLKRNGWIKKYTSNAFVEDTKELLKSLR